MQEASLHPTSLKNNIFMSSAYASFTSRSAYLEHLIPPTGTLLQVYSIF